MKRTVTKLADEVFGKKIKYGKPKSLRTLTTEIATAIKKKLDAYIKYKQSYRGEYQQL